MFLLLEINNATTLKAMVFSMPESAGVLASGIGLVVVAALLRSFFARSEKIKAEEETLNEA